MSENRGNRFVPIVSGLVSAALGLGLILFFNHWVAFIPAFLLFLFAWSSLKIGLFGSQRLTDEMTSSSPHLSAEANAEWRDIHNFKSAPRSVAPAHGEESLIQRLNRATLRDELVRAQQAGDVSTALEKLVALAEDGDPVALGSVSELYSSRRIVTQGAEAPGEALEATMQPIARSMGLREDTSSAESAAPQDHAGAASTEHVKARQGDAASQLKLWSMYFHGSGVPEDRVEAARWLRLSAEQGLAEAQYTLGKIYSKGDGVLRDYTESAHWYELAAEQGLSLAQFELGRQHEDGRGVPPDDAVAELWYGRAARNGHPDAQSRLDAMYTAGRATPPNPAAAEELIRRAAERGDAVAQLNLGMRHERGDDVAKDYGEAVMWYLRASEQGLPAAQCHLGRMFCDGMGVPQDYVEAHKWFNLSASRFQASDAEGRSAAVKLRDQVAAKMTTGQIAEAQRLAREWKPRPEQQGRH